MAHWFYMCLSDEGHILVATLRNHMKQNNDFIKAVLPEYHVPPYMRMSLPKRMARLFVYVLMIFAISAQFTQSGFDEIEAGSRTIRRFCQKACQVVHFPSLSCGPLTHLNLKIGLHGNVYDDLWKFTKPVNNDNNISKTHEPFEKCKSHAISPLEVTVAQPDLARKQRMHVCFSECRRSTETEAAGYGEDTRSRCMCEQYAVDPVAGVTALRPCPIGVDPDAHGCQPCDIFDHVVCVNPKDPVEWPSTWGFACADSGSIWCMSWFRIGMILAVSNFLQLCFEYILMLNTEETEDVYEFSSATRKCAGQAIITITCLGLFLLTFGPYGRLTRLDRIETLWMTFLVSLALDQAKNALVQPIIWFLLIRRCGRISPGIQEYNEDYILQWDAQESLLGEMQRRVDEFLQWKPIMMGIIGLVGFYALFVLTAIAASDSYEGITLVEDIFKYGDFAFLCLFITEIVLKTFAYGMAFVTDIWNIFDSTIVIVSFVFFFLPMGSSRGLTLLRLLRLLRVMMVMRKVSQQRKKLQSLKKSSGAFDVGTNADKVMELLEELMLHKSLEPHQKAELDWVMEMITSNKLYSVSLAPTNEENEDQSDELNAWLNTSAGAPSLNIASSMVGDRKTVMKTAVKDKGDSASAAGGQPAAPSGADAVRGSRMVKGQSQVRSSAARGSRRQSRRQSKQENRQEGAGALHVQLYTTAELTPAEEDQIEQALEDLNEFTLDLLTVSSILDVHLLPIVFLKIIIAHDLISPLKFDFDLMYQFCVHVQAAFHPQVQFHAAPHTADMLQTCHYLFTKDLEKVLHQPLDKFILLFSALIGHAGHPGLTNDFLIKCRHPWAIMYNDRAVCQNYSLATFFSAVADPELNFMLHLRPEQLNAFRQTCIQIILKLDLRQHFSELGLFTTKLGSETFPSDSQEDRILMMSVALRVADLSWTCRSLQTYNKWSDRFLEEFFVQGDLEKQIGAGISCFCDRDAVNTSKTNFSFIMVVAMPVITTFTMVLDNKDCQESMITDGLEKNKAYLLSWTA